LTGTESLIIVTLDCAKRRRGKEMIEKNELHKVYAMFKQCAPLFIALGDQIRQKLILDIADAGLDGLNVSNLTAKTLLSRPAISHHLKVLKDCGLVEPHKIGTQVFYRLHLKENLDEVKKLISSIEIILETISPTPAV
jgi:ArsR family transcriptional regulator, arsenate/arsenite/antimonite-responsive transcriptional repressor